MVISVEEKNTVKSRGQEMERGATLIKELGKTFLKRWYLHKDIERAVPRKRHLREVSRAEEMQIPRPPVCGVLEAEVELARSQS